MAAKLFRLAHTTVPTVTRPPAASKEMRREKAIRRYARVRRSLSPVVGQCDSGDEQTDEWSDNCGGFRLHNAVPLSMTDAKKLKLSKSAGWRWTYCSARQFVEDFKLWYRSSLGKTERAAETAGRHLTLVWKSVDPKMRIGVNPRLASKRLLENNYFVPLFTTMRENMQVSPSNSRRNENFVKASTISSRLISLRRALDFIESQDVYIGIEPEHSHGLRLRIKELQARLRPYERHQRDQTAEYKATHRLTHEHVLAYGNSAAIAEISESLLPSSADSDSTVSHTVKCRNHLMVILALGNALRASNLINMTLRDVTLAQPDQDFPGAFSISSTAYKTSMIYGQKKIVAPRLVFDQLKVYIAKYRSNLIEDTSIPEERRYVFTSNQGTQITHSGISNGMTSIFKLAGLVNSR